jgi:DUF2934 family protein
MAKEKNSSGESAPTKSKQSTTRKTASQSRLKVVASSSPAKTASNGPSPAELDQEIRLRAYEFFCERGGHHGAHEDDWLRAEQEVCAKYQVKYSYGT